MTFILPLVLGFCIAFLAVILPGLINMTAAKISLQESKNEAISFAAGAATIVFFQTFIAVMFARFISNHKEIVATLQEIAIFIFSGLDRADLIFENNPGRNHDHAPANHRREVARARQSENQEQLFRVCRRVPDKCGTFLRPVLRFLRMKERI